MSSIAEYFKQYFKATQKFDGSWDRREPSQSSLTRSIVYTCQILLALDKSIPKTKEVVALAQNGIRFLGNVVHPNPMLEILMKTQVYTAWPELSSLERAKNQLLHLLNTRNGEFGGRLNLHTFELCLTVETLLNSDTFRMVLSSKRKSNA